MLLRNGRYQIEKRLGKGGAGDVYLARDQQLFNRPVVVKRLRVQETDARDRAEAERNFEREAQALAELNNPRFPQILDFFIDPPLFYLVMEYVAGEDLDHRLEDLGHPLSEDEVRFYEDIYGHDTELANALNHTPHTAGVMVAAK